MPSISHKQYLLAKQLNQAANDAYKAHSRLFDMVQEITGAPDNGHVHESNYGASRYTFEQALAADGIKVKKPKK